MRRRCRVIRVFTVGQLGGNPLGVVTDLAGLDDGAMQSIAARLGFSETVYFDPSRPEPFVRIFTPVAELDFAGHPLVGSAWVLGRGDDSRGVMRCGIGPVPWHATPHGAAVDVPHGSVAGRVALPSGLADALGTGPVRECWEIDVPQRYQLVEVATGHNVAAADPDFTRLAVAGADGVFLYARSGDRVRARFFAPRLGVDEDPATGSAAAALATLLAATESERGALTIRQGPDRGEADLEVAWTAAAITLQGSVREDAAVLLDF